MRWDNERESDNVEDRQGVRVSRGMVGGGLGTIVLALVAMYFGLDPSILINQTQSPGVHPRRRSPGPPHPKKIAWLNCLRGAGRHGRHLE